MAEDPTLTAAAVESSAGTGVSRRSFLKGIGIAAGASVALPVMATGQDALPGGATAVPGLAEMGRGELSITLRINGEAKVLKVELRTTLLSALRDRLDLTGAKEICDRGACGGCTVLLDGKAVNSCLILAVDAQGAEVITVEGIAADPKYAPLIDSFCEHDGAQCGYCIPGFVVRSAGLLGEVPTPTPEQVREGLAGNLCRCGTYTKIFAAMDALSAMGGLK